jgi:hypothetical protein
MMKFFAFLLLVGMPMLFGLLTDYLYRRIRKRKP